jgi:uncharacterized protein YndB with AHSA1/START domain
MTSLHLTRTLSAPPERVWRAFTDPARLAAWFWPARFGTTVEVDLRPGGRYRIDGVSAGMAVTGSYLEVDPPQRLVFTWQWDGEEVETLVTITLATSTEGTELRLVHEKFPDGEASEQHAQGWSDCLDRLPRYL